MKLEDIARKSIDILVTTGKEGITTSELAKQLDIPKRRIYDVKAIMKAANLIKITKDEDGTKLIWNESSDKEISIDPTPNKIRSKKVKISNSGIITNVSNKGTEVIIEGSEPDMEVEAVT